MLIVHHLNNSRSQRVLWLLEELGLPYEIIFYQRGPDMRAPQELRAIHPLGKSPVVTDDGKVIAETGAILTHILEAYGGGRLAPKPGAPENSRYAYWLHYAEGSAMPLLVNKLIFSVFPKRFPALLRPFAGLVSRRLLAGVVDPDLTRHMDFWEKSLTETAWFAGPEFTAADVQMSFPLEAAAARAGLRQGRPKAAAFLDAIHARPAYQRALARGGPYAFAGSAL
jgi:glutathione S-transferase